MEDGLENINENDGELSELLFAATISICGKLLLYQTVTFGRSMGHMVMQIPTQKIRKVSKKKQTTQF